MKIASAAWHNHPILGELSIKFTKPDGSPYSTIVIAGENGSGKTTVLNSLFDFCNFRTSKTLKSVELIGAAGKYILSPSYLSPTTPKGVDVVKPDGSSESWYTARETYN